MIDAKRFESYFTRSGQDDCWEWRGERMQSDPKFPYGRYWENRSSRFAHRVAWELANGVIPTGLCVLHRCDNPPCVNPSHLFLGTRADNMADMDAKGRRVTMPPKGEKSGMAKLDTTKIVAIRAAYESGEPQRSIARRFGVCKSTVGYGVRREIWAHT